MGGSRHFGNACVSRRQIISSGKKEDKAKIIEKYKIGSILKDAICKGVGSFGVFFNVNNELDVLVHQSEVSYSRVNDLQDVFSIGDKSDLKIISIDKEKLQVGCSIKQLSPDPFEKISNYELNKKYEAKVVKLDTIKKRPTRKRVLLLYSEFLIFNLSSLIINFAQTICYSLKSIFNNFMLIN